ncbi:MAG: hypothetical protein F4151_01170 [Gammaproteobacteria bacterium]|nr:hypothetical protein [Gammaproteobacteria bacterium]
MKPFGWKGRRAEWIALACCHGGVFTRVQWTSFLGSHHEKVGRAVRKLVAQGVAIEEKHVNEFAGRHNIRDLDPTRQMEHIVAAMDYGVRSWVQPDEEQHVFVH